MGVKPVKSESDSVFPTRDCIWITGCRFDKLPFDFAQGLSLPNGKALSGAEGESPCHIPASLDPVEQRIPIAIEGAAEAAEDGE